MISSKKAAAFLRLRPFRVPGNTMQNTSLACSKLNMSRGQEPTADAKKDLPPQDRS